jgi:membrane-associated protease RseP (regulator of RpoE activity)
MDNQSDTEFDQLVAREMVIEQAARGEANQEFALRYTGRLRSADSAAAFERLDTALSGRGLMPLFRLEDGRHVILLVKRPSKPKPSDPRVNFALFLATVASVFYIGILSNYSPADGTQSERILAVLAAGGPFTLAIIAILAAHEFGHYFLARFHKIDISLPYFIPFPLPFLPFGTLGVFTRLKEPIKNRAQLLQYALAGPLASLVVSVLVLLLGLMLSPVKPLPSASPAPDPIAFLRGNPLVYFVADQFVPGEVVLEQTEPLVLEGNSALYLALKALVHGRLLPAPASYDIPPGLYWLRNIITGQPIPFGGVDVMLHPLAWAGWFGLLLTGFNLIPIGQMDGGHVLYTLLGRENARRFTRGFYYLCLLLGLLAITWWFWAAILHFFGRLFPEPRDEVTPLDARHQVLAVVGLVLFLLIFIPIPLSGF